MTLLNLPHAPPPPRTVGEALEYQAVRQSIADTRMPESIRARRAVLQERPQHSLLSQSVGQRFL